MPKVEYYNLHLYDQRPDSPYEELDRYDIHLTDCNPYERKGDTVYPVEVMRHHIVPEMC